MKNILFLDIEQKSKVRWFSLPLPAMTKESDQPSHWERLEEVEKYMQTYVSKHQSTKKNRDKVTKFWEKKPRALK